MLTFRTLGWHHTNSCHNMYQRVGTERDVPYRKDCMLHELGEKNHPTPKCCWQTRTNCCKGLHLFYFYLLIFIPCWCDKLPCLFVRTDHHGQTSRRTQSSAGEEGLGRGRMSPHVLLRYLNIVTVYLIPTLVLFCIFSPPFKISFCSIM